MARQRQKFQAEPDARLHFRVSPELKEKLEKAALLRGQTLTSFSESVLLEQAEAVLAAAERINLSEQDFIQFCSALDNPGEPSSKLIKAVGRYKQHR